MDVNQKGVKGLIKVIDDLQDKGAYCFTAFDDHSPVDIIALLKNGKTVRLQVKYRSRMLQSLSENTNYRHRRLLMVKEYQLTDP